MTESTQPENTHLSVADRVLAKFVEAVAENPQLEDVASRLKPLLKEKRAFNENDLRQALFGEASE